MKRRPRNRFAKCAAFALAGLLVAANAGAKGKAAPIDAGPPESERVDISSVKADMRIVTDGKNHFVALVPFGSTDFVFYGDGKRFFQQRVGSSSSVGKEEFDFTFWEPRVKARYQAGVGFKAGKWSAVCGERTTSLSPLPDADSAAMVAAAGFFKTLWKYHAYALARDDSGTYYYVDRLREPADSLVFRVYRGPRGKVLPLKMTNVVSDSGGEIFATRSGELRLVLDRNESTWVKGKAHLKLASLPIEDNAVLIYRDLGPYTGMRLGTPCDDL